MDFLFFKKKEEIYFLRIWKVREEFKKFWGLEIYNFEICGRWIEWLISCWES